MPRCIGKEFWVKTVISLYYQNITGQTVRLASVIRGVARWVGRGMWWGEGPRSKQLRRERGYQNSSLNAANPLKWSTLRIASIYGNTVDTSHPGEEQIHNFLEINNKDDAYIETIYQGEVGVRLSETSCGRFADQALTNGMLWHNGSCFQISCLVYQRLLTLEPRESCSTV